jgi:protein SCO1/2
VKTQRSVVIAILVLGFVVAAGLRAWLHPPLHLLAAQLLPQPKSLADDGFTVDGKRINLDFFKGHWVLIYLGYTSCPDVCPLEMQKLAQMLKKFSEAGEKAVPVVLFVSVDPERDKPDILKGYVKFFNEDIVGVTGKNSELAELASALGASYNRTFTLNGQEYLVATGADMPSDTGDHYLVNHSSRIFIMDDRSRYVGSFAPPHDAATLFTDMQQLIRHGTEP